MFGKGSSQKSAANASVYTSMRQRWSIASGFRLVILIWAAGGSVAAARPLDSAAKDEQNYRSDCQPKQVHSQQAHGAFQHLFTYMQTASKHVRGLVCPLYI